MSFKNTNLQGSPRQPDKTPFGSIQSQKFEIPPMTSLKNQNSQEKRRGLRPKPISLSRQKIAFSPLHWHTRIVEQYVGGTSITFQYPGGHRRVFEVRAWKRDSVSVNEWWHRRFFISYAGSAALYISVTVRVALQFEHSERSGRWNRLRLFIRNTDCCTFRVQIGAVRSSKKPINTQK